MGNACPVILVHGMVGWGPTEMIGFPYWGTATWVPSPLARHVADIGPISSLHDRACELAYQIRCGGPVDYGAQHANDAGHDRYGHQYTEVLHPAWSEAQPVHLVGHSMGGPTAFLLQQLLAEDYFGWNSNERWIASISSISGVLNGSTATYYMGCDETTGYVNPHTAAMFLGYMVEMFLRATGGKFDRFYDFHLEQWRLPLTRGMNLAAYIANIAASAMFKGTDNGAYSLTIQNLLQQNARCRTYPKTYYFSYATDQSEPGYLSSHAYPRPGMNAFLIPTALYIGNAEFAHPFYSGFRSEDWWPNDGLVSVYSQEYPRIAGKHDVGDPITDAATYTPGKWHHTRLENMDHIDIVALPQVNQIWRQAHFYQALFKRLAHLDIN